MTEHLHPATILEVISPSNPWYTPSLESQIASDRKSFSLLHRNSIARQNLEMMMDMPEERVDELDRFDEGSDVLGGGTDDASSEGEEYSPFPKVMESTHQHLLPFDTDPSMERNEKSCTDHSIIVEDADSELEHLVSESEDCVPPLRPHETTQHSMRTMYRGGPLKAPVDPYEYIDSLHSRLDSTHFRRNERKEDYLDFLFEKIESVACEMDGQPETVKDILDEAFEFMEDAACGKMARQRQAELRQSFEHFLQQIDRLASLAPQGDLSSDPEENKDLLDIVCQHFEKAACDDQSKFNFSVGMGRVFSKELLADIIEYFNRCTASPTKQKNVSVVSLLSVSEASSEGIERFKEPLCKISEESSSSFVSSQRSHSTVAADARTRRLRNEMIRRTHLRRLRGSIHGHISKKDMVNKVAECRDTVHEAFGTAGEHISSAGTRLATIFENFELDRLWETLVLAMAFSPKHDDADDNEMETVFHLAASDDDSVDDSFDDGVFSPEPSEILKDLAILPRNSQGSVSGKLKETIVDDSKLCTTRKDSVADRPIVLATSSEDTYASGCGSGRSGSGSKRFQQVNDMKKIKNQFKNKLNEIGRLTPNSNMTEPTCDETISASSDLDNEQSVAAKPIGARRLKMVDSESSRLEKMEMVAYMSIHNRNMEAVLEGDVNLATENSERSHKALSVDAAFRNNIPLNKSMPTVLKSASLDGLPPRPSAKPVVRQCDKAPTEISFSSRKQHDGSPLVESMPCLNLADLDPDLGKASNRTNRSLFLQDSGSVSAVSMDETPALVRSQTANSGVLDDVMSNDGIVKQALSVVESFCESFVSARQSEDSDDVYHDDSLGAPKQKQEEESTSSFASAKSKVPKPRLAQTPCVLDEGPDDELHCVFKKHIQRPPQQQNDQNMTSSTDTIEVVSKVGVKSWFSPLTEMFTSKTESPSWFGNQTVKAMLLLLYVSASVAATSAPEQDKFKERASQHRQQDDTACPGPLDEVAAVS